MGTSADLCQFHSHTGLEPGKAGGGILASHQGGRQGSILSPFYNE